MPVEQHQVGIEEQKLYSLIKPGEGRIPALKTPSPRRKGKVGILRGRRRCDIRALGKGKRFPEAAGACIVFRASLHMELCLAEYRPLPWSESLA